jgi:dihydrofolate reductase
MNAIIACDPKGGIGYNNKLPWDKIEGDLPRFKTLTTDKLVIMGRNTWDSLPKKPLPNRTNIVVTSKPIDLLGDIIVVKNIYEFINYPDAWIIGGASLIQSSWSFLDTIYLTRTFTHYKCDTFIDLVKLHRDYTLEYKEVFSDHTYEIWKR